MQKTIKINPELFTIGKSEKTNKEKNKSIKNKDISSDSKNGKVKQKLLDKIKNFQKNRQNISQEPNLVESEISTFNESLSFLDNLSNNYQNQKNKTIKSKNLDTIIDINTSLPDDFSEKNTNVDSNSSKTYGCLKNGSLPTFREWKRMTQKNKDIGNNKFKLKINTENNEYYDNIPTFREKKLTEIKARFKENNSKSNTDNVNNNVNIISNLSSVISPTVNNHPSLPPPSLPSLPPPTIPLPLPSYSSQDAVQIANIPPVSSVSSFNNKLLDKKNLDIENMDLSTNNFLEKKSIEDISCNLNNNTVVDEINVYNIPKILRKTKTLKFKLGRNSKNRKIGIYIKNRETQKNIKNDFNKLKNVDINEVKKYLRKHNLITSGSSSPNDVLRELYEKSILSGDVTNKNTKFLVNNFINDE